MSKKYIAIHDCEYQGRVYRTGEWILFPDDVEVATLFWKSEEQYKKEQDEEIKVKDTLSHMSEEEKDEKIKSLTKRLKAAEKTAEPAKEKGNDK